MELLLIIGALAALAAFWAIRSRRTDDSARDERGRFLRPEGDDRAVSGTRVFWKPDFPRPPGAWRRFPGRHEVMGVSFRRTEVLAFLSKAKRSFDGRRRPLGLDLRREPGNPMDPNAIAIYGVSDGDETPLGYVAREVAAELALAAPAEMPLAGVLTRVAFAGPNIYIRYELLVPSKASPFWRDRAYPFGRAR